MIVSILDDYFDTLRTLPCFKKLGDHEVTVWTDHAADTDTLVKRLEQTEALVLFRERTSVQAELLDRLSNLKLISQRSDYPHIDVDACTRNNVMLCSKQRGGAASFAAAELTFGLILSAMRQIPQQMAALKAGTWQIGVGHTLHGKTLGIHSYGRIGKSVAGYARGFGMNVVVWGGDESCQHAREDGFTVAASREDFFSNSDVISLHIRLKPETRGSITLSDLSMMKPGALLVNTSRAGLIEPGALVAALNQGRPGMAAVDVYDNEPVTGGKDPLLAMENVVCTPHIGFVTKEDFDLQFSDIFDQVNAYAKGQPIHIINPEVACR